MIKNQVSLIVVVGYNSYLTEGDGEPQRTELIENAKIFKSYNSAVAAIKKAKKSHPFKELEYKIIKLNSYQKNNKIFEQLL